MNGDRIVKSNETLQDGDTMTVTLKYDRAVRYWTLDGTALFAADSITGKRAREGNSVVRPAPAVVFLPGDVVVVKHFGDSKEFTYVRGGTSWPGERTDGLTDRDVALSISQGRARLIARKGVAFPGPITRDNLHVLATIPF